MAALQLAQHQDWLIGIRKESDDLEQSRFRPFACQSPGAVCQTSESLRRHRQSVAQNMDLLDAYRHVRQAGATFAKMHRCYERLFAQDLEGAEIPYSEISNRSLLRSMATQVREYPASMTDAYFVRQAAAVHCEIPERICLPN